MKENRGLLKFILLTIITLGIYSLVFYCKLGKDINKACEGESKQIGYIGALLLGCITFGIVPLVWGIKLVCRIYKKAEDAKVEKKGSVVFYILATTILCETVICPLIAFSQLCKTTNNIAVWYNKQHAPQAAE